MNNYVLKLWKNSGLYTVSQRAHAGADAYKARAIVMHLNNGKANINDAEYKDFMALAEIHNVKVVIN